jgi:hypothetical protein
MQGDGKSIPEASTTQYTKMLQYSITAIIITILRQNLVITAGKTLQRQAVLKAYESKQSDVQLLRMCLHDAFIKTVQFQYTFVLCE